MVAFIHDDVTVSRHQVVYAVRSGEVLHHRDVDAPGGLVLLARRAADLANLALVDSKEHGELATPLVELEPAGRALLRRADRTRIVPMQPLKAHVRNGRLVLDEPTDLPEGTEVSPVVADEEDDLDDEERARLHASLKRSMAQAGAGHLIDAEQVVGNLLSRLPAATRRV